MLMLTHTWILRAFLGEKPPKPYHLDIFTYNIAPDLMSIHQDITSSITHGISRCALLPPEYSRSAFVQFHLLVDDIAHYGKIMNEPVRDFDPDPRGYTYVKGKSLVEPIKALCGQIGKDIGDHEAIYMAHIIIEMAFDLMLSQGQVRSELINLFSNSLDYTATKVMSEFARTLSWLFGISPEIIAEALTQGHLLHTRQRMEQFVSKEGRMALLMGMFHLDGLDPRNRQAVNNLMNLCMHLVSDYEDFLASTLTSIREAGFELPG